MPLGCAEVYDASLPNSRIQVLEGLGHLVELEDAQATADAVAAHIGS